MLFSKYSHNRIFGKNFVQGRKSEKLAERNDAVKAVIKRKVSINIDMSVYEEVFDKLFDRNLKRKVL